MKKKSINQLTELKKKFKELTPKERERISICFLKVKLGVHHTDDFDIVTNFLGDFELEINTDNLDAIMNYLHSSSQTLPEFIALEQSLSDLKNEIKASPTQFGLEDYDPDDVETLKESLKPFK